MFWRYQCENIILFLVEIFKVWILLVVFLGIYDIWRMSIYFIIFDIYFIILCQLVVFFLYGNLRQCFRCRWFFIYYLNCFFEYLNLFYFCFYFCLYIQVKCDRRVFMLFEFRFVKCWFFQQVVFIYISLLYCSDILVDFQCVGVFV